MTSAVSDEDENLFKWFKNGKLLVSIIFIGFFTIGIVLWAKRQILRVFLITKKGPLDQAGSGAPKELRKEILESFRSISEMRLEPKLLSDQGQHEPTYTSFVEERDDSSYKHRRKAFDLMSCLDEVLSRVNISLSRKPSQTVREHLIMLQSAPYAPFEGLEQLCEEVTQLYEHARYGAKGFAEKHYKIYSNKIDQLYDKMHQKLVVPGSLVVHTDHQHYLQAQMSNDEGLQVESQINIPPSALVESRMSGLRNRESKQVVVT